MPADRHERLRALRRHLLDLRLDGFILSTGDEHMSEIPAAYANRLAWLTGFTGSTGTAVVMADHAAIFVDGRYAATARGQVEARDYDVESVTPSVVGEWLARRTASGARIGYDPRLCTRGAVQAIRQALAGGDVTLAPAERNPIDAIWRDQPPRPTTQIFAQPDHLSGRSSANKRRDISDWLGTIDADAAVLVALDSIAWLFNIRACDIATAPLSYSFAICHRDGTADLFVDASKLDNGVRDHLGDSVRIAAYEDFYPALTTFTGKRVSIDPNLSPAAIHQLLDRAGAHICEARDPTQLPKAMKNPVEIAGMKQVHVQDGVALTRFLHWIAIEGPKGEQTELSAAAQLFALRRELPGFHGISFEPISAVDANAAMPHYVPTPASNRLIGPDSIYLIDSGGQYPGGTTDVTRTIAIGIPRSEVKDRFTRVLKGHIAIARLVFPAGTMGFRLDPLARMALWEVGLDYPLGTGHGVGHFLNVHEGPAHMLASPRPGDAGIEAGMILSNEPGYYKEGDYGIRTENLVVAVEYEVAGAEKKLLRFETITLAPIDRRLIDPALMTDAEIDWIDTYHQIVLSTIGPLLPADTRRWLEQQTAPLERIALG
ncbi:aminopeptidase P family protein [Sphingomonas lycopersici]|uniref:Aminopeptidase P family protein n=1 Tax=Sphingomonas lycopersici TaxID=2951807 RepID=A0AA41ZBB0_9SPHN|nr:aminopeptidase P family protein [Sphingomonas lycopersici]MCW6536905.1 aminopeptidase P family protein [Sphingomonas lycopersici]